MSKHDPRLVTLKCAEGLPNLRTRRAAEVVQRGMRLAQRREFRIVHYSIERNHVHMILEADDAAALANGMRSFTCRAARGLNRVWGRRGAVFPERFHDRPLRSLLQVRNALRYVLNNYLKHGHPQQRDGCAVLGDPFSSADCFTGWRELAPESDAGRPGTIVVPGRWKLSVGWRTRYPLISAAEAPGAAS